MRLDPIPAEDARRPSLAIYRQLGYKSGTPAAGRRPCSLAPMRLARFHTPDGPLSARLEGGVLVPFDGSVLDQARRPDEALPQNGPEADLVDAKLLAPFDTPPPSVRDFYAFERHVATARRARGLDVPPEWYQAPVFYFTNPAVVHGPDEAIAYPQSSAAWDYELEFAWVMGRDLRDATPDEALEAIAGFTIFNDCSARDIQRAEMAVGLGPSKGKDFAHAFGPVLVTPDEFRPGAMVARVNGIERSRGHASELHFTVGDMIAHASRDAWVRRGDVMGSGTCGTGCLLELRLSDDTIPWLASGDVVELEVESIGVLRNRIA